MAHDSVVNDSAPFVAPRAEARVPQPFRRYKKNNEIACYCQRLLRHTVYPTPSQIAALIHVLIVAESRHHQTSDISSPTSSPATLRTLILEWFRKRREYLATKVYRVCDDVMANVWSEVLDEAAPASLSFEETVHRISTNETVIATILERVRLPVVDETAARAFVQRKVEDYFTKLCSKQ